MKNAATSLFGSVLGVIGLGLVIYSIALAASGALDPTFSGDGKATLSFGGKQHRGYDVAVQPDGKVVVVSEKVFGNGASDIAVARYNANGKLDKTFSGDGRQTVNIGRIDQALGVALQTDGKIVVGGQTSGADYMADVAVARLNKNGTLDRTFGGDGIVTMDFESSDNGGFDLAIMNGKIVVAGYAYKTDGTAYNGAVYRFNKNGLPDAAFGRGGVSLVDFGGNDVFNAVTTFAGKIYAAGYSQGGSTAHDFAVARLWTNGAPDPDFSGDGKVRTNLGAIDAAGALAVSTTGKVVVAGYSGANIAIAQYTAAGALDRTFSGDGKLKTAVGSGAEGVAVMGGMIMVAGRTSLGDALLMRFTAAGKPDSTFGVGGKVTTDWGGTDRYRSLLVGGGRIYAVGTTRDVSNADTLILVARYRN